MSLSKKHKIRLKTWCVVQEVHFNAKSDELYNLLKSMSDDELKIFFKITGAYQSMESIKKTLSLIQNFILKD